MKPKLNTKLMGGLVGILLPLNLVLADSELREINILEGCSSDLIEEFKYGHGVFDTNPYQRILDGEGMIITGMSPFSEEEYIRCLTDNGFPISLGPLEMGLSLYENIPPKSNVMSIIQRDGTNFYLFHNSN